MDKLRDMLGRAMRPRPGTLAACIVATVVLLALVFSTGGDYAWWAYPVYLFSALTLALVVVAFAPHAKRAWGRIAAHPRVAPFVENEGLRAGIAGGWSVLFDLAYAVFIMVTAFNYDSGWAGAVALYHVAIAGMGFALAFGLARARKRKPAARLVREYRLARTCGVLLALMAVALAAVVAKMVLEKRAWVYSEVVVISNATFVFVNMALAVRAIAHVRQAERPAHVASRSMGLSKTLVQLFFLETTMIATFGGVGEGVEGFRFTMEAATGAAVLLAVAGIAAALVAYAVRGLRGARGAGAGDPGAREN